MNNVHAATRTFSRVPLHWIGIVLLALGALYFSAVGSSLVVFLFSSCALAGLGAIGLNLLLGTAGQVSIGNAGFLAVGAFGAVWVSRAGGGFVLSVVVASLLAVAAGVVAGLPALRLRGIPLALSTLAATYIAAFIGNLYQTNTPGAGDLGFWLSSPFSGTYDVVQGYWLWLLTAMLALAIAFSVRLTLGKGGRAWRMIRDHEEVAATLGIKTAQYKLVMFGLSSGLIGTQGALTGYFLGQVSYETFTLLLAIQYLAMILVGGLDSVLGALIGATAIVCLPTILNEAITAVGGENAAAVNGSQYANICYGALIVLFIVSSPNGIMGWLRSLRDSSVGKRLGVRARATRRPIAAGDPDQAVVAADATK